MRSARRQGSVLTVVALACACLLAQPARADDVQTHFDKGNAAFEAEHYDVALAEYQAAWKISKVYDLAAIMGQAEMRLGKYRDAAEHLSYALANFPLTGEPDLRKNTESSLTEVKKQVATVRIVMGVKDAAVTVDGTALEAAQLGKDIFLAEGSHTIEAKAPGYAPTKKTYAAKGGDNEDVKLTLQPETGSGSRSLAPALVLGGVGLVGIVLGAALVGTAEGKKSMAFSLHNEIKAESAALGQAPCIANAAKCKTLQDTSRATDALGNAGVAAFIFGGVAGAAAAAYMLVPSRKPARAGTTVLPVVGAGSGGVLVSGSF